MVKDGVDEDLSELLLEGPRQRGDVLNWRCTLGCGGDGRRWPGFHPGHQTALQQQSMSATSRRPSRKQNLRAQLFVSSLPGFLS